MRACVRDARRAGHEEIDVEMERREASRVEGVLLELIASVVVKKDRFGDDVRLHDQRGGAGR
jgi:hypothetical protein